MPLVLDLRAAMAVHHTPTDVGAWDGAAMVAACPADKSALRAMHAWVDPAGDPAAKASYKLPHHMMAMGGDVGAANEQACSNGIAALNGGRGGVDIPSGDRQAVWDHLAAHLRDANTDNPDYEPPGLRGIGGGFEERAAFRGATIELRDMADGRMPKIVGHAAVYGQWSQDLGGFKERVMPGAFAKALNGGDIRALFNHDPNFLLGRTTAGTLALADEKKGLHFEASPPDTQTIRDLVVAPMTPRNGSDRADLSQCSFAFLPVEDEWRAPKLTEGLYERDLHEVVLYDVSAVTFPAYDQTDVGLRMRLAGALGLDLPALTGFLARTFRGTAVSERDLGLIRDSITVLRSYLPPEANGGEPSSANAGEASHSGAASIDHLRRLLDLRTRSHAIL